MRSCAPPGSARSSTTATPTAAATTAPPDPTGLLAAALARFDAPVDLRVRGGLGSGRRTLAAALRARGGWRVSVDDIDVLAAPTARPAAAPDIEILCLRTAPCRHEEAWVRRPRRHPLLVVATGLYEDDDNAAHPTDARHSAASPRWVRGLPTVDAREPEHRSVDAVIAFVERAMNSLADSRVARLEAELERLAVHAEVGELAEAALCALEN
ncbi:hypothetical protein [uncultured Dietzia sp.]|uniref:hypothetical protein n=1 Tax=uncultured Dietzia sp. TaxID=395519 RepID=UPI0025D6D97B|nr:hypothetical protein [uncultured Dietzia sp.]